LDKNRNVAQKLKLFVVKMFEKFWTEIETFYQESKCEYFPSIQLFIIFTNILIFSVKVQGSTKILIFDENFDFTKTFVEI